jgi:hypothetical protein
MIGLDLTGQKFGPLTVLADSGKRTKKKSKIRLCLCECGNLRELIGTHVKRMSKRKTKGCYCCGRKTIDVIKRKKQPLYFVYYGIKSRCYKPAASGYQRYGGKGIAMCDERKNSYEAFRGWALANGYEDRQTERAQKLTIDRIDPNGNYEPSNCRRVTLSENSSRANRRAI